MERANGKGEWKRSVVVASLVYHTAMRDEKLPRVPLPKPKEEK